MKIFHTKSHSQRSEACEFILNCEFPLTIRVSKYAKPRSLSLNNYYWGFVCTPLAAHIGESPKRMHEILCKEYFGIVKKIFRGHTYEVPRRTTTTNEHGQDDVLTGEDFRKFLAFAESVCFEMDVQVIPWERVA